MAHAVNGGLHKYLIKLASAFLQGGERKTLSKPTPFVVRREEDDVFIGDMVPVIPGSTDIRIPKDSVAEPTDQERDEILKKIDSAESL